MPPFQPDLDALLDAILAPLPAGYRAEPELDVEFDDDADLLAAMADDERSANAFTLT